MKPMRLSPSVVARMTPEQHCMVGAEDTPSRPIEEVLDDLDRIIARRKGGETTLKDCLNEMRMAMKK